MKRRIALFFAVWLSLGSLFPQTDLEELCKVPMLWLHYQAEHADLSFLAYLQAHYSEDTDEQCPAHKHLPMQKHSHTVLSILFIPCEEFVALPAPLVTAKGITFEPFRQVKYRFLPDSRLFSPPKQA